MKSFKALLIFGYILLSGWWLIINLDYTTTNDSAYYCLGLALYFIVLPAYLTLVTLVKNVVLSLKLFTIFMSSGVLFFGLSFLSSFCGVLVNGIDFQHITPVIFYMFQFPLCILGLIEIWYTENGGSVFILFTLFVFFISYIFSQNLIIDFFSLNDFYKFYLPIKSLVLLFISVFIFQKTEDKVGLFLISLGFLIWFFGDLSLTLFTNYFDLSRVSYSEFLYLSSIFLLLMGVFGYLRRRALDLLKDCSRVAFLTEIPYQAPFSLNARLDK